MRLTDSRLRLDVWRGYSGSDSPHHQVTVQVSGKLPSGEEVAIDIPGGFGEGESLTAAVKAAVRNLSRSIGRE